MYRKLLTIVLLACLLVVGWASIALAQGFTESNTSTQKLVFSIPVGENGVAYGGTDSAEMFKWGPNAFTVGPDGSFWILDSVNIRVLNVNPKGEMINSIELSDHAVGLKDMAVDENNVYILDVGVTIPKVVVLSLDGQLEASYDLPPQLRLESGLSGISLGERNQLLIEQENGAFITELLNEDHEVTYSPQRGHTRNGQVYTAKSADLESQTPNYGYISVNADQINIHVSNTLAGMHFLRIMRDGSFYIAIEEAVMFPVVRVDKTVHHYSASGQFLGSARIPISSQYVYVENDVNIDQFGNIYTMMTHRDRIEVYRLSLSSSLPPVLQSQPEPPLSISDTSSPNNPDEVNSCIYRDTIISNSQAYLYNSTYLSSTNIDGSCPGRGKPHYLGGAGNYSSVPYAWGDFDTISEFNSRMSAGYQAGDIALPSVEGCSRGVDCSGFVHRVWNHPAPNGIDDKLGTSTIPNVTTATSQPKRGDVYNNTKAN